MLLLAVCLDGTMYFCAGASSQKGRNLARDPRCVLTASATGLDVIIEGAAEVVTDDATLNQAAEAYLARYGWEAMPQGGAFMSEGAPTAGPPPLTLYRLVPETAFAFGTDEALNAMRWTFKRA